jgi:membrane-bound lytic murein transglycosylase D
MFNDMNRIVNPTSSTAQVAELPSDKYTKYFYTVRSGDNLGLISMWYNVRLSDIRYWNNIRSNVIRSGQKLVIYVPNSQASKYKDINSLSYTEKQKRIGKSSSVQEPSEPEPVVRVSSSEFVYYTVKNGDSLWQIAKKFPGVSDSDIAKLNNLKNSESIKPGQVLKIMKN